MHKFFKRNTKYNLGKICICDKAVFWGLVEKGTPANKLYQGKSGKNPVEIFGFFQVTAYWRVFIKHLTMTNVQNKVFTKNVFMCR